MKNKTFILGIITIMSIFLFSEISFAAKTVVSSKYGGACTTVDELSKDECNMVEYSGCWFDQSATARSLCAVGSRTYLDKEYTWGEDKTCLSWQKSKDMKCPSDDNNLIEGENCFVTTTEKSLSPFESWKDIEEKGQAVTGKWDKDSRSCIACSNKIESAVCGDQVSTRVTLNMGCTYEGPGAGKCDLACGASPECNEKLPTYSDSNGTCDDGNGDPCNWVPATTGIILTVSAASTEISAGGSSVVTFTVKNSLGPVTGATVKSIELDPAGVTSNATLSVNTCTTNTSGTCTTSFNASGSAVGSYTIKAAKAEYKNDTSLSAAITIIVRSDWVCKSGTAYDCLHPKNNKDCLSDLNGTPCGNGGMYSCTGNCDDEIRKDITEEGWATCVPEPLNAAASAEKACGCSCLAAEATSCTPTEACSGWTACGDPISGQKKNVCSWSDCGGGTRTMIQDCCLSDADCTNSSLGHCDVKTEICVACLQDSDCGMNERCFKQKCVPCKTEGAKVNDPAVCCLKLDWWDIDFDDRKECTSKCNPGIGFYCNTLRSTVDNIVQGGETMIGYILGIIGSVALLLIIISGVMYMTAAGVEEKITSAKKILTGAVIGLSIALLAFSLLQVLMTILNL